MTSMALSMKPTGWFQIGWSHQIEVGQVVPLRFFGRDLVAYRTESGELVVLNAYCEHLGAHLGHGGSVHGEEIQCPFHGWRWDSRGKNTCIPYQDKPNRARKIPSWITAERDGVMYIWHALHGDKPPYEVPSIFEMFAGSGTAADYHPISEGGTYTETDLPIHPQYVIENGVDFAHFKYVHRADELPVITRREFLEHEFQTDMTLRFKRRMSDGRIEEVEGTNSARILGVGLGFSYAAAAGRICSLTAVTPIDEETSVLFFSGWASKEDEDEKQLEARRRSAISQVRADIAIWRYQRYTEPPGLATAEAVGFRDIRQWARRFYPAGEKGHDPQDQLAGTDASSGTALTGGTLA